MEATTISAELKSHFLKLYQIALSDGEFSSLELKVLYEFANERGISNENLDQILLQPIETDNLIPDSVNERLSYLYDFAILIWADNKITSDEMVSLKKYISRFGFLDENIDPLANYLLEAAKANKTKQEIINELNYS